MRKFYVYKHTNVVNGKIYIGKSNNPSNRWARHICDAKKNSHDGSKQLLFHRAINKYGSENFIMEILGEYDTNEKALSGEKYFIEKLQSNNRDIGYNLTIGGEGVAGYHRTPEQCAGISKRNSGIGNGMFGKTESLQSRQNRGQKISEAKRKNTQISVILTEETREKLKKAVKEKSSQQLTDEQKDQIISLYETGEYVKRQLAEQFNVELKTIMYILRYWNTVKNNKKNYLTDAQKSNIIKLYELHTMKEISKITGFHINRVEAVIKIHQRNNKIA